MYAHGIYRITGHFLDCIYEAWNLDMFGNTELAVDEIISPLQRIIEDVRKGVLPIYVAREVFNQRVEAIESGPYPALNYLPDWEDFEIDGRIEDDIWCEEEPLWTILMDPSDWNSIYPNPGANHGFDPMVIISDAVRDDENISFVAFIDWHSGTLTVIKSSHIGRRKFLGHDASDAEQEGDVETYLLTTDMENAIFAAAVEYYRVAQAWEDINSIPSDEQILEKIEDEYGYIPGSLPSQYIGIPHYTGPTGLA